MVEDAPTRRACLTGLATAKSRTVVVFLDGDYSDRPAELPILLAPISGGSADITLGSREPGRVLLKRCLGIRRFGNGLAASIYEAPLWTKNQ